MWLDEHHEQLGHDKADESTGGEGEEPGEHHVLDHAKVDGRKALDGSDAHDGAGLDVRGRRRSPDTSRA